VSCELDFARVNVHCEHEHSKTSHINDNITTAATENDTEHSPPPQYPASEASSSRPPAFSSLFAPLNEVAGQSSGKPTCAASSEACASGSVAAPAYSSSPPVESSSFQHHDGTPSRAFYDPVGETKRALPQDTKGESSRKDEDSEPPPAYSEGDSPIHAFTYVMSAAGGAASIITQVQQGGPPINAIGGEDSWDSMAASEC
jgi:G patch domain-containing protein 1